MKKLLVLASIFCACLLWAVPSAAADPIGPGQWTLDSPQYDVQLCAGGQADGLTFTLPASSGGGLRDACSNGKERAERRFKNYASDGQNYSTGIRQFAGTFTIQSMTGDRISLKQTFNGSSGPYFMLAVDQSRRLYNVEGGAEIAPAGTATDGTPIQVDTIHNTATNDLKVYINGNLAYEDTNAPGGDFYDKFGAYETASGNGPITVTWSNVNFWYQ
ncbi:hypothetical protein [Nocardia terpenica]|uniref:hypothetical protein n=1 Tax=Nocardia terpenica TaxID=455432 RepID=UPI0019339950|nr:hypothetical protein [Nocardia terpenica]